MTTLKEINNKLEELDIPERLERSKNRGAGRRYYFFTGGNSYMWPETIICTNDLDNWTVDDILEERDMMINKFKGTI